MKKVFHKTPTLISVALTLIITVLITSCQGESKSFDEKSDLSNVYGKLTYETFYGPPGYGEDPTNDSKVKCLILILEDEPINETPKIQVVYLGEDDLSSMINKKVRVIGTFFSSHTGGHNTPILIETRQILNAN